MKLTQFETVYLSGGPYCGTIIDCSLTLCEILVSEDEDGQCYVRRGYTYVGDCEQLAFFKWEAPDETKNTG